MFEKTLWYPVYTHPRAEKAAYELLVKKGIETYLPLKKTLKQWSDRKKWVEEPLLKSYLFVQVKAEQKTEVLMTKGIARFIYFSGKIASIPASQISMMKQWLSFTEPIEITQEKFKKGEFVEIIGGNLMGLKGELIDFHHEKRLVLKLEGMGHSLLLHVPKGFVRHLNSSR